MSLNLNLPGNRIAGVDGEGEEDRDDPVDRDVGSVVFLYPAPLGSPPRSCKSRVTGWCGCRRPAGTSRTPPSGRRGSGPGLSPGPGASPPGRGPWS